MWTHVVLLIQKLTPKLKRPFATNQLLVLLYYIGMKKDNELTRLRAFDIIFNFAMNFVVAVVVVDFYSFFNP